MLSSKVLIDSKDDQYVTEDSSVSSGDVNESSNNNHHHDLSNDVSGSMDESTAKQRESMKNDRLLIQNGEFDEILDVSESLSPGIETIFSDDDENNQGNFICNIKGELDVQKDQNVFKDQVHDDVIDVSEDENTISTTLSKMKKRDSNDKSLLNFINTSTIKSSALSKQPVVNNDRGLRIDPSISETNDSSSDGNSIDDDHLGNFNHIPKNLTYDPLNFMNLDVSAEIQDLFRYIQSYQVEIIELDTVLKCFIPEYIPTVGTVETFVTIPRPDGKEEKIGLVVLDEPSAKQSDPAILELQIRSASKVTPGNVTVRSIENAHDFPGEIDRWISSIEEIRKQKPSSDVLFKRKMPEIDVLMQTWPKKIEDLITSLEVVRPNPVFFRIFDHLLVIYHAIYCQNLFCALYFLRPTFPGPLTEMRTEEYARFICSLMDIPVYDNVNESLYLLFSVYKEFKSNPHFAQVEKSLRRKGTIKDQTVKLNDR